MKSCNNIIMHKYYNIEIHNLFEGQERNFYLSVFQKHLATNHGLMNACENVFCLCVCVGYLCKEKSKQNLPVHGHLDSDMS